MRKSLRWIVLVFCFIPLIVGCSKLKNKKVVDVTKQLPIVCLVNIPPDESKYSINPRIYWYGTDPDGYIDRYQYIVIPEIMLDCEPDTSIENCDTLIRSVCNDTIDLGLIPTLDGYIDSFFVMHIENIPPDKWNSDSISAFLFGRTYNSIPNYSISPESMLVMDSVGSKESVRLFAELDTLDWVSQYIFIRAVDNDGLTSKIWKPDQKGGHVFRRFSRNNHPPETKILWDTNLGVGVYYCLPETTETWKGIEIRWEGSDPIDYPLKQPDFLFKWELLGPFADTLDVPPDTSGPIAALSYDSLTSSRWVWDKYKIFVNLKNYENSTYGWYLFKIRSKDDALVVDETPAYTLFKVIHPYFTYSGEKKVLLVDASHYTSGLPTYVDTTKIHRVREIYESHLSYVQSYLPFDYVNWMDRTTAPEAVPSPDLETLSLYNLVIVVNYSHSSGIPGSELLYPLFVKGKLVEEDFGYAVYINYLDVGGKVWFIGTNNFGLNPGSDRMVHRLDAGDPSSGFNKRTNVCILGDSYFGLERVFFPKWEAAKGKETNEEFVSAEPFLGALEFPSLEVNSARLDTLIWWDKINIEEGNLVPQNMDAILGVNYEVISGAERIYTFVSFLGSNSEMHGMPCGSRFIGSTFKTAEFCFPLFLMKDEQAKEAMRLMIEWFFEE